MVPAWPSWSGQVNQQLVELQSNGLPGLGFIGNHDQLFDPQVGAQGLRAAGKSLEGGLDLAPLAYPRVIELERKVSPAGLMYTIRRRHVPESR